MVNALGFERFSHHVTRSIIIKTKVRKSQICEDQEKYIHIR